MSEHEQIIAPTRSGKAYLLAKLMEGRRTWQFGRIIIIGPKLVKGEVVDE